MELLEIFIILVALISGIIVSLILYARWNYGTLESLGIPVVKPHWFLGSNYNYTELYHHWEDWNRAKKLGLVYGVYNGKTPEVYVADPEILHRIFFKDSDCFRDKPERDYGHKIINEMLDFVNGDKWKLQQSILSPLFTSAKIKRMIETVGRLSEEHTSTLKELARGNSGRVKLNLQDFVGPFAIEVIGECLCGIQLKDVHSPSNAFVTKMKNTLYRDIQLDWTFNVLLTFPFLQKLLPHFPADHLNFFVSVIQDILDRREASGEKMSDTVNALLELRQGAEKKEEFKAAGITVDSVYGQAYEFFAASYAGIITTLNYLCYYLATNADAMRCVREEVDSVLKKYDGNTPHEALGELRYLAGAIQETLRISPAFFRPERQCTKDWDSGKGYKIKKGTRIIIPVYAVHHNPQVYPEPDKFKPERFLPENKDKLIPCTFLPFGQGQRQCMGMKLVIEILKSFMVRIVRDFEIKTNEDTVWKEHPGIHFILKLDPIYLDFILRKGQ